LKSGLDLPNVIFGKGWRSWGLCCGAV